MTDRWHTERSDKMRKRDFEKRLNKALDKALAKEREKLDGGGVA